MCSTVHVCASPSPRRPHPKAGPGRPVYVRPARLLAPLALLALAGCATTPKAPPHHALRPTPAVTGDHARSERAILDAFFRANKLRLRPDELEQIIPHCAPRGHMDRNHLRRAAQNRQRVLMAVKADPVLLERAFINKRPLLIMMPHPDKRYAVADPMIPVSWNRETGCLQLLDGAGVRHTIAESDFFSRREPLKQAALLLISPNAARCLQPAREQQLALADFWLQRGAYRKARAAYTAAEETALDTTDTDAILGQATILFRKKRYHDARCLLLKALELDPDNPAVLNNLAYAMLQCNDELLTALRHATKAHRLDPQNPLILETMGSINLRVGDAPKAAHYLELAWANSLQHSPEVQIAIMDQLTRAWIANSRQDLALQVAEQRRRAFPSYRFPRDILTQLPALRGRPATPP